MTVIIGERYGYPSPPGQMCLELMGHKPICSVRDRFIRPKGNVNGKNWFNKGLDYRQNWGRIYNLLWVSHLNWLPTICTSYLWQCNSHTTHIMAGNKSKTSTESTDTTCIANETNGLKKGIKPAVLCIGETRKSWGAKLLIPVWKENTRILYFFYSTV